MAYELLPPEPGDELTEVSPGFTDRLMQRIADYERKEKRRRLLAILLAAALFAAVVAGIDQLRARRADDGRKQVNVSRHGEPTAAPAPQPKSTRP